MSDSLLISAHKAGDKQAISLLMDRHKDPLMGFLVNRVGGDADDLYQETWVRVSTNLITYDERGSFRSWLFQIARRLVIDHHRRALSGQSKHVDLPEVFRAQRAQRGVGG